MTPIVTLTLNCEASKVSGSTNLGLWTEWRMTVQGQINICTPPPTHKQVDEARCIKTDYLLEWPSDKTSMSVTHLSRGLWLSRHHSTPLPAETYHKHVTNTSYIHTRYTKIADKISLVAAPIFLNYMVYLLFVDCHTFGWILDTYQITEN